MCVLSFTVLLTFRRARARHHDLGPASAKSTTVSRPMPDAASHKSNFAFQLSGHSILRRILTYPGRKIAMNNDELVGTWKLVSALSKRASDGGSEAPYGANPVGFLTYSRDGRVMAILGHGDRKLLPAGGGTLEEQAEAFKTFLAYAGRYKLSGDRVSHYVEVSSIQNYVGKELVRSVKYQADQIILVTPPTPVNGKIQTIELTWQRLPANLE